MRASESQKGPRGETVSPQHRAFCLGAERSVASVTTRAGAAVEGQRAASIVQKSCVEKGFTERCVAIADPGPDGNGESSGIGGKMPRHDFVSRHMTGDPQV